MRHALIMAFALGVLAGCAPVIYDADEYYGYKPEGSYHTVQKDETLWQIAQVYNIELEKIIKANNIANVANIKTGQKIFIPRAQVAQKFNAPASVDPDRLKFAWPVDGEVMGFFNSGASHFSKGIKIRASGILSVRAARAGRVVLADYLTGYGQVVIVDHQDGFMTVYGRMGDVMVRVNDHVLKGDKLAEISESGEKSFLYFEVRKDGAADNPLFYLPKR